MLNKQVLAKFLIFFCFSCIAIIGLQDYVGDITIYSNALKYQRLVLHNAILNNQPPPGVTWKDMGAEKTNIRILAVYLANIVSGVMHLDVNVVYKHIDTISMILILIIFFYYLKNFADTVYAIIGIMYVIISLVNTYFFYYFHPWDRLSCLVWTLLLCALKNNRVYIFAGLLAIGMLIKYDVILLPGLYFAYTTNRSNINKSLLTTACLFAMTFGIYFTLLKLFPMPENIAANRSALNAAVGQLVQNFNIFKVSLLSYAPIVVFGIPLLFSAYYLLTNKIFNKYVVASAMFGMLMFIPYLTQIFHETRAEMPILLLIMPSVLLGLRKLIEGGTIPNHSTAVGISSERMLPKSRRRGAERIPTQGRRPRGEG